MASFFNIKKGNKKQNNNYNQNYNYQNNYNHNQMYNQQNNPNLTNFNNSQNVYRPSQTIASSGIDNNNTQTFPTSPNTSKFVPVNNNQPKEEPDVLDETVPSNTQTNQPSAKVQKLDPLNNSNNPIPVNPVAPKEQEDEVAINSKTSLFIAIGILIGLILHPCGTVTKNTHKYKFTGKAFGMFLYFNLISVVACLVSRVLFGGFTRTYNSLVGAYSNDFNISNLTKLSNYLWPLIGAICITCLFTLLVSLVYYACSFMNSRGITYGTYLMVAEQSIFPFFVGVFFLYPLCRFASSTLALVVVIISFLYTFLIYITSMGEVLTFKSNDRKIFYNLFNILIIGAALFILFTIFMRITNYDLSYIVSFIS